MVSRLALRETLRHRDSPMVWGGAPSEALGIYRDEIFAVSFRKILDRKRASAFSRGERCSPCAEDTRSGCVVGITVFPAYRGSSGQRRNYDPEIRYRHPGHLRLGCSRREIWKLNSCAVRRK